MESRLVANLDLFALCRWMSTEEGQRRPFCRAGTTWQRPWSLKPKDSTTSIKRLSINFWAIHILSVWEEDKGPAGKQENHISQNTVEDGIYKKSSSQKYYRDFFFKTKIAFTF